MVEPPSGSPHVPYYYGGERPELVAVAPRGRRRALELGCGVGAFAVAFLKVNPDVEYWGVEAFPPAAAEARQKLDKVFDRPVEQVYDDLPDGYFDLLVCNDVLEHMADPETVLRALLGKLEPGGLLFASVPNVRFLPVLVDLLVKKDWRYRDAGVLDRTHLRFYTEKSLRRMIAASGFQLVSCRGINSRANVLFHVFNVCTLGLFRDSQYLEYLVVAERPRPG